MRILLVDDSPDYRSLCCQLLPESKGYHVVECGDALEAWWRIAEPGQTFDLAILDVSMPSIDGLELARRIRSTPWIPQFPIILCTGNRDRETVVMAANLGIVYFIAKPFTPALFLEKIATATRPYRSVA